MTGPLAVARSLLLQAVFLALRQTVFNVLNPQTKARKSELNYRSKALQQVYAEMA